MNNTMNSLSETILNIYLIINDDHVVEFRAKAYESDDGDQQKIEFLKSRVKKDFNSAYHFEAPTDKKGAYMPYRTFSKLERRGMHFELFEEIFEQFNVPENPLVCVTPVVNDEILGE